MNLKIASDKVTDTQEITVVVAEDQDQYLTLPANYKDGLMAFAFELTEADIEKIQKNKRIYISLMTFGGKMNPINVAVDPKDFDESCKYNRELMIKNQSEETCRKCPCAYPIETFQENEKGEKVCPMCGATYIKSKGGNKNV